MHSCNTVQALYLSQETAAKFSLRISLLETMHNFSDLKFGRQYFEMMKDFLGSGTENPRVGSSILPLGTTSLKENADLMVGFFFAPRI